METSTITRTSWAHVWTQMSESIELVFVLCESPPLTGISHDKPSFLLTFHFLLLPQHNFSKSYHKQSAIILHPNLDVLDIFLFLAFHCYLNELNFLAPGIVSISLVYIFLPFIIIQGPIFQIFLARRYMFRLMAQEFEHILCNYIEISFYLLLLLAKMKILLNKGRRIFISNSLTWWSST